MLGSRSSDGVVVRGVGTRDGSGDARRYTGDVNTRRVIRGVIWTLMAVGTCALGGCNKPLLSPDEPRTQFDRYDSVRNQYADQYAYDEWGKRRPNLRARLLPRE